MVRVLMIICMACAAFDMQSLPPGVYIVKDGAKSYKLINDSQ